MQIFLTFCSEFFQLAAKLVNLLEYTGSIIN